MDLLRHSALLLLLFVPLGNAQSLSGQWDGAAKVADGVTVPLHLELAGTKSHLHGALVDGAQKMISTEGTWKGDALTLKFAQYAITLQATLQSGKLNGIYSKDSGTFSYPFELSPHVAISSAPEHVPQIAGVWVIPTESAKGEHAWRLIVHQTGPRVAATILRIDGDTGTLAGEYRDGTFHLSHFQDTRPTLLDVTPASDGSLLLRLAGPHIGAKAGTISVSLQALRAAPGKDIPKPDDPESHTYVKDSRQPFRFRFPDLSGKPVSNDDSQFKGKVVLVNITGSWCPNCHDEAPCLEDLYRKYHPEGFEIVALDFEEPEQKQSLTRLHAFLKRYGITYTYLLAGEPSDVALKLPQAVNLTAWPTSFLLGRDGRVHFIETGFPSAGSREFYSEARRKYAANIEELLSAQVKRGNSGAKSDQVSP